MDYVTHDKHATAWFAKQPDFMEKYTFHIVKSMVL
jgi:hypothetical protein